MPKQKIAILGGGVGALGTAWELSNVPGWDTCYEITVYQLDGRIGRAQPHARQPACERFVTFFDQLIKSHQVWVYNARKRPELLLEQVQPGGRNVCERLERHTQVAFPVERFENHAHAPAANLA